MTFTNLLYRTFLLGQARPPETFTIETWHADHQRRPHSGLN